MYTSFILFKDTKPQATLQKMKHNLYCYKLRHYTWGASRFCNIHVLLSSIAPFLEGILCPDVMLTTYRFGIHFKLIGGCTQQRIICRSKIDFTSGDAGFDTRRIYTFMNERLHERWRRSWLPEKFPRTDFNRHCLQSIKCTSTGIGIAFFKGVCPARVPGKQGLMYFFVQLYNIYIKYVWKNVGEH